MYQLMNQQSKFLIFLLAMSSSLLAAPNYSELSFDHVVVDQDGPRSPWGKTMGDLDNDGLTDLIVGGHKTNIPTVAQKILRKLGLWDNKNIMGDLVWYQAPTWKKRLISNKFYIRTSINVGDLNNDKFNDIVATTDKGLIWFENPGTNYQSKEWIAHSIDANKYHDVVISDLDLDGHLDLIARNQSLFRHNDGNTVNLYYQNATTTKPNEKWKKSIIQINHGEGLKVSNINKDAYPDIVVNQVWLRNPGKSKEASWTQHQYTDSWTWQDVSIDVADINNDTRNDIILTPSEKEGQHYRISWFAAPKNPTKVWLENVIDSRVEAIHHAIQARDYDKDGNIDILTSEMNQGTNPDEIKIYLNKPKATPAWEKQVISNSGSHNIQSGDVDNDLDMDFFGTHWEIKKYKGKYPVHLWKNQTSDIKQKNWVRHVIDPKKPWKSIFIVAQDIDGDNLTDIITGGWWYKNPGMLSKHWTRHSIGKHANNIAHISDYDNDGDIDVLASRWENVSSHPNLLTRIKNRLNIKKHNYHANGEEFVWGQNDGSGNFKIFNNIDRANGDLLQGSTLLSLNHSSNIALSWHKADQGIQLFTIPSQPTEQQWVWQTISPASQDEQLTSGDIDNDGDADLLLGTQWLENTQGVWALHTLHNTNKKPDRSLLKDMNKDGLLDAVIGYEAISKSGLVAWYKQNKGALWEEHIVGSVTGPMSLSIADMDNDDDIDIIIGEHSLKAPEKARLMWFENTNGLATSWESHLIFQGDEHHNGAITIDIDNDGDNDVISIGWTHGRVLLYENRQIQ